MGEMAGGNGAASEGREKGPNELAVLCLVGGGFDRVDVRSGRSMLNAEMTMGGRSKGRKL